MYSIRYFFGSLFVFLTFTGSAQVAVHTAENVNIDFKVDFIRKDTVYSVMFHENAPLFYYYIISSQPIDELSDRDLFIDIVDAPEHGWPVLEAGYIDTRYGVHEFTFDLNGKNLYILATNGVNYSRVAAYDFHSD